MEMYSPYLHCVPVRQSPRARTSIVTALELLIFRFVAHRSAVANYFRRENHIIDICAEESEWGT
jgi:hypothetical protein